MSTTTIWNILNNDFEGFPMKRGIEIPMIQRDYAQGRDNNKASEIRKVFLDSILSGVTGVLNEGHLPLELDFIYGYLEHETFIPLDGQQRLTTLYLLLWYFAFKDGQLDKHKVQFSRFNYQTRQSSEDFLKQINIGLDSADHSDIFEQGASFASVFQDKNWYFYNWKYDLTIQSAITMLDAIHLTFSSAAITFEDLIDTVSPKIVFNFLNIEDFGLSDDLYIKMNARGKPLTNFENLKAELGKFIELSDFNTRYNFQLVHSDGVKKVDLETYFITKIDTSWSDYFWKLRDKLTNQFDDKLLNLMAFVALNEVIRLSPVAFDNALKTLDFGETELTFYRFKNLNLLNESTVISYVEVLDLLVSDDPVIQEYFKDSYYLDKEAAIKVAFEPNFKPRYEQRILWYAIFKFLIVNRDALDAEELSRWDRLVRNLVINTQYNNSKDFQDSIIALDELCTSYSGDIYQDFKIKKISGFDGQQIREEQLKIILLQKSGMWGELIHEAEAHTYLKGQIIFLLSFSGIYQAHVSKGTNWTEYEELDFYNQAELYFKKFKSLFSDSGLRDFEHELFRRALLAKGDYTLYSTNWSFVIDNHRDISWKRLLRETINPSDFYTKRRSYLLSLFDEVDLNSVEGSLSQIINNHNSNDWRKDLIEHPVLMQKSLEKYFKYFDNGDIYLLRKSKYNKYADPELKSLLLKEALLKKGFSSNDIELGFIESLNQYGISRVKQLRPKITFNHDGEKSYLLRQKGKPDFSCDTLSDIVKYIVANF